MDPLDAFAAVSGMVATGERLELIERFIAGLCELGDDMRATLRQVASEGCRAAPAWSDISDTDFPGRRHI